MTPQTVFLFLWLALIVVINIYIFYNASMAMAYIKSEYGRGAGIYAIFGFSTSCFTKEGNRYRKRVLIGFLIGVVYVALSLVVLY